MTYQEYLRQVLQTHHHHLIKTLEIVLCHCLSVLSHFSRLERHLARLSHGRSSPKALNRMVVGPKKHYEMGFSVLPLF